MIQLLNRRLEYEDDQKNLRLYRDFGTENELYESVLEVRSSGGGDPVAFGFDEYSSHHVAFHGSTPIGTVTTTRPRDGGIDCHACYPPSLFDLYGDQMMSGCKLRINPNPTSGMFLLRLMFREAWREQLEAGVRIDVINVRKKLVPFYQRIGYVVVEHSDFVHPTLGTESVVVVMPADPTRRSFCRDLFEAVDRPLMLRDVREALAESSFAFAS